MTERQPFSPVAVPATAPLSLPVPSRRKSRHARRRGWLVRRSLAVADLFALLLAFGIQSWVFPNEGDVGSLNRSGELIFFLATLPAWVVLAKIYGLYDRDEVRADHSTADDLPGIFHLATTGAWLLFAGGWLTGVVEPNLPRLFIFWICAIALITCTRAVARSLCRRSIAYIQNTVIVGSNRTGQLVARKLLQHPEYGINVIGFVDEAPEDRAPDLGHVPILGTSETLLHVVEMFDVERVVIASADETDETLALARSLKDLDVQIDIVPRLFEIVGPNVGIHTVEGMPLIGLPALWLSRSSKLIKRTMDVVVAFGALVVLLPLFLVCAVAIKLDSKGPVFFRQERMGTRGRTFRILKLRTMTADAEERKAQFAHLNRHRDGDARMFKIPNDPRTTRVGRILRRFLLDELPQLVNVLRGEMSLVGPRPLILDEDRHVGQWARRRLDLKPGMTGPWQVLGRSAIPFEEMVKLDYLYVTNWSLGQDVRLLLRTIPIFLKGGSANV